MKQLKKKQTGVSLMELMVSLAIGVILLLALSSVYITANQSNKTRGVEEGLDEAARQIFERLQQDLNMAGFVDVFDKDSSTKFAAEIAAIKTKDTVGLNIGRITGKEVTGYSGDYVPKSAFTMIFDNDPTDDDDLYALVGEDKKLTMRYQGRKIDTDSNNKSAILGSTAVDCNGQGNISEKYVENSYLLEGTDFKCNGNGGSGQTLVSNVNDLEFKYLVADPLNTKSTAEPLNANASVYDSQAGLYITEDAKTAAEVENTTLKWAGVTAVQVCVVVGVEPLNGRGNAAVREFQATIPKCDGTTTSRGTDDTKLYRQYTKVLSIPNALYFTTTRQGS